MKQIFRISLGIVWLLLYILRPLVMLISFLSNKFLSIIGGFFLFGGVIAFFAMEERNMKIVIFAFAVGCILLAVSPLIVFLTDGYQNLLEKLRSMALGLSDEE